MEMTEEKRRKLITELVAAANKVVGENRIGNANYIIVPEKNIEAIAKKFKITIEEAQQLLEDYFQQQFDNNIYNFIQKGI